jgi:hypothetical protein
MESIRIVKNLEEMRLDLFDGKIVFTESKPKLIRARQ